MAETSKLRARSARDVVRPLARVVERPCSRPACGVPAQATLTFRYGTREAWIEPLSGASSPQAYDLCQRHAARTSPPNGWQLRDRRPEEDRQVHPAPAMPDDLGGDRTVAVLAAALRAVPDIVSEDAVRASAPEAVRVPDSGHDSGHLDEPVTNGDVASDEAADGVVVESRPVLAVREPGPRATRW